jgi:sulfite exporter TauE/SafE
MLDLFLILSLGFLGSFGHCTGMCGPLTVAFSLSQKEVGQPSWQRYVYFHSLLNLGRITSYVLVGAGVGGIGSLLIAGGQFAGIDSPLRRAIAILTGLILIWIGLNQIRPGLMPGLPMLHPLQGRLHDRLSRAMLHLSFSSHWWTPALLGMAWGLIPCGFLYIAQIKAAETGSMALGAATMLAFGLGTFPVMLGVGVSASLLSRDRRSQLFRLGGWITLTMGVLLLLRTSEMVDLTGHAALLFLMLALIARPISRFWLQPLQYRRALGVGAFVLALAHTFHMLDHSLDWNLQGLSFMLPTYQVGMWLGIAGLTLMTPAALTSFDWMMWRLGDRWRLLHLLAVPALICCTGHTILVGSHYLGNMEFTNTQKILSGMLVVLTGAVLLVRFRPLWAWCSLEKWYAPPLRPTSTRKSNQ